MAALVGDRMPETQGWITSKQLALRTFVGHWEIRQES